MLRSVNRSPFTPPRGSLKINFEPIDIEPTTLDRVVQVVAVGSPHILVK